MRTTRKQVESAFSSWIRRMHEAGAAPGAGYRYGLDYNSTGGYMVVVVNIETGGQHCPFGYQRRSAGDMFATLRFAYDALDMIQPNGK